jgi:hypothetical protein
MSQGCCGSNERSGTAICPVNGRSYPAVQLKTVLHHVRRPWEDRIKQQAYYFCSDPDCEVVYFAEDQTVFRRVDLRQEVGQKSREADRPLCYCFDVRWSDALQSNNAKGFVVEQTRESRCECDIRNPSGKCCLKDFPKK